MKTLGSIIALPFLLVLAIIIGVVFALIVYTILIIGLCGLAIEWITDKKKELFSK